jgi:hypothetical protein
MTDTQRKLEAVQALGYSEEEARFLYLAAMHSGYFVPRQFRGFIRSYVRQRTAVFSRKLRARRHAQIHRFAEAGVVYHLCCKGLYREIGQEDLRHRHQHEFDYVRSRIAMLDFVLANPENRYLETESSKVRYFCTELSVPATALPAKSYLGRHARQSVTRYFADAFPMFLPPSPEPRVVAFTYIQDSESRLAGFTRHLHSYLPLFRQLSQFRFLFLSATDLHFAKARELFRDLVITPLEPGSADDLLRYFTVRKAWELGQYESVEEDDLIFRNAAKERFGSARFEHFYRAWTAGRISCAEIREKLGGSDKPRLIQFEVRILQPIDGPSRPTRKEEVMSIVKKAPAILTREVRLEEPVSELLDDYAQFIESSADYVVNCVLKRILWRDLDYRKWRDERRALKGSQAQAVVEERK